MEGLLGPKLLHSSGEVSTSTLAGVGVIGLYFSAHWCGPCQAYTPQLRKVYQRCKDKCKSFEIVFVSSDRDEESFRSYFGTMPWYAVPFSDRMRKQALDSAFQVRGIPALVLISGTGSLLDPSARSKAMSPAFPSSLPRTIDTKDVGPLPSDPVRILVHHQGATHEMECEPDEGWELLRMQIFSVTEVPEEQQRLFGLGVPCGPLDESVPLARALAGGLAAQRGSALRIADIPDSHRKASSVFKDQNTGPHDRARMDSDIAWYPEPDDKASWYQLDLGQTSDVAGVVLAGNPANGHFVRRFKVSCAESEGGPWLPADGGSEFEGLQVFPQQDLRVAFKTPVHARLVRIMPTAHNIKVAMRCDVLLAGEAPDEPPAIVVISNASKADPFEFRGVDAAAANPQAKMVEEQHLAMLQAKLSSLPGRLQQQVSSLNGAKKYDERGLQKQALDEIPVPALDTLARQEGPSSTEGYEVVFMKKVLLWYKKFFFSWTNSPKCDHCGSTQTKTVGSTKPNQEEQFFGAGTVEVAQCELCGLQTRFPRYNDPGKLLEWRTGRCGEWANCFTLVARALGYEARHVHDWTDHVWTEVYCDSLQRWAHVDSCEQAFDTPMVYEQGWGKKLTYCLAFARDHAVDVTQRYTRKFDELLTRRTEFSEQELRRAMLSINEFAVDRSLASMPEAAATQRREALELRGKQEEQELEQMRRAQGGTKAEEQVGRTSGDANWREQRGELGANAEAKAKALELSEQGLACVSTGSSSGGIPMPTSLSEARVKELLEANFKRLVDAGTAAGEAAARALLEARATQEAEGSSARSVARPVHDHTSVQEWKQLHSIGPLESDLKSLDLAIRWRDQGAGNQKGRVRAVLRRGSASVAEVDCFGVALHSEAEARKQLGDKFADQKAAVGDSIVFEYLVGGGGGHQLHIESFEAISTTVAKSTVPTSHQERGEVQAKIQQDFAAHVASGLSESEALAAVAAGRAPKAFVPVKRVEVMAGDLVDQVKFVMANGEEKVYGAPGGVRQPAFELSDGEFIVEVQQRSGNALDAITLRTNLKREQTYGNPQGGTLQPSWSARPGMQIVGLVRPSAGYVPPLTGIVDQASGSAPAAALAAASAAALAAAGDAQAMLKARFAELVQSGVPPNEAAIRVVEASGSAPAAAPAAAADVQAMVKARFAELVQSGVPPNEAAIKVVEASGSAPAAAPAAALAAAPAAARAAAPAAAPAAAVDVQAMLKARFAELVKSGVPPNEAAIKIMEEAKKLQAKPAAAVPGLVAAGHDGGFKPPERAA